MVISSPRCRLGPSRCWLVQEQTAPGKDLSNPLTAGGLLKITRLSGVPQFSHLATPEVMAFGKEFKIHQVFKTVLLGTSNSLVWGIDECLNTHHFILI